MNLENLTEGLLVKNYKELCIILDLKQTSGDSKKSQLKELERFCVYEKQGNKFIIKEIYTEPLEKYDGRINNKGGSYSIYAENIDRLILHMSSELFDSKYNYIDLNANEIMKRLKMINDNYKVGRNNISKFSNYLEIPIETIFDFYNSTQGKNRQILESGLNRLSGRCLIKWTRTIKICTINRVYRNAGDDEIEIITEIEQQELDNLNLENKKDVFLHGKWDMFNKNVNKELIEQLGILFYFQTYHIITTEKFRNMLLDERDKDDIEFHLNQDIRLSSVKSAEKRHNKVYDKYKPTVTLLGRSNPFNEPIYDRDKNRLSDNYIKDSKTVCNICIDTYTDIDLDNELVQIDNIKYTYKDSIKTDFQKEFEELTQDFEWDDFFQ